MPYDFEGENLTAYGGLLPIATMLEKLDVRQLAEGALSVPRRTKAMSRCVSSCWPWCWPAMWVSLGCITCVFWSGSPC